MGSATRNLRRIAREFGDGIVVSFKALWRVVIEYPLAISAWAALLLLCWAC